MSDKSQAIANILNDVHFQDAVKQLVDNQMQRIVYSNSEQTEVREQAYQRIS
jgi:hypothetical protein